MKGFWQIRKVFPPQGDRGYTLLEIILAVALGTLLLALIFSIYEIVNRGLSQESDRANRLFLGRLAADRICKDIRSARRVKNTYGGYTSSSTVLILESPSYNSSGLISGSYDYIIYRFNSADKSLRKSVFPASGSFRESVTDLIETPNVTSVAFRYYTLQQYTGDGNRREFILGGYPLDADGNLAVDEIVVKVGNSVLSPSQYTTDASTRKLTLNSAPSSGTIVEVTYALDPARTSNFNLASLVNVYLTYDSGSSPVGIVEVKAGAFLRNFNLQ